MSKNNTIFYLTTAKVGIHSFSFTELSLLKQLGIPFILGLVQLRKGPFMPKDEWQTIVFKMRSLFFCVLFTFLRKPLRFSTLILESFKDHHMRYMLIAVYFFHHLRKKNIADIHVQMGDHKLFIGYYLSQLLKTKLTTTIHAHELYQPLAYSGKTIMQKAFHACYEIITISKFNKQYLIDHFGIEPEKIRIMYLYPSNIKENDSMYCKKILIVASWIRKKGYEELLQALSQIKLIRDDFSLWVVGTDIKTEDESIDVPELIRNYHLEKNVVLLGSQPNPVMNILFEYCDIFCLPSITDYYPDGNVREREGIPVALMEAMSWKKPIITTLHAGIPELVEKYLVGEKDVSSLKEKILFLLDNPDAGIESGKANRKIVLTKFNTDNVEVISDLFNRILH